MFFFLCVCECSLTSAKSVQPNLFKVSANEGNIKGERKHPLWEAKPLLRPWNAIRLQSSTRSLWFEASVTALETSRAVLYSAGIDNSKVSLLLATMHKSKIRINRWWIFGHGRKSIFAVFYSSAAEEHFFAISAFCRSTTDCFHRFSCFGGRRRTIFTVFCVSSVDDECFFAISAFRLRATNDFQRFPFFRGVGNAACGIFRFSQT